jgi:hypothetical protein
MTAIALENVETADALALDDLFLCFLFALVRRGLQRDGAATSVMVISGDRSRCGSAAYWR